MKRFFLAVAIAASPVMAFAAEPFGAPSKKTSDVKKSESKDATSKRKSCAEYGQGFVWVETASSCVKMGGYVRFQAGARH